MIEVGGARVFAARVRVGLRCAARRSAALAALLALIAPALAAGEERLVTMGDTLRGEVADLTSDGVEFKPVYGKGSVLVKWSDVENVESDTGFLVLYGDDAEAEGRLLGMSGGRLLVGDSPETAQSVDVSTLFHAYSEEALSDSFRDRMRRRFRYWAAAFNAGAAYTDSTTDTVAGNVGLFLQRKKAPTLFLFEAAARYASERKQGESNSITENTLYALGRGEYDLTERIYGYASTRATYDFEQHLSLRLEPRAGAGYHWIKSKTQNFSTDVGAGWVYENFFGDEGVFPFERARGTNSFWAIAFGAQADAELPYGVLWRARAEYLPGVEDWTYDYLLRAETSLEFPLLEWLAFRAAIADEYDNTPAEGAQRNRFVGTLGLVLRFL